MIIRCLGPAAGGLAHARGAAGRALLTTLDALAPTHLVALYPHGSVLRHARRQAGARWACLPTVGTRCACGAATGAIAANCGGWTGSPTTG
jgi:hypothetical protein